MQGGLNRSKDDQLRELPKIQSQKRIHTTTERRITQQDKVLANRPLSNNNRTRSLRTLTTKTMKYQGNNNLNKKLQQLQRKHHLIDKQMKQVQQEINIMRKKIGDNNKNSRYSNLNDSKTSYISKIKSRKVNGNNGGGNTIGNSNINLSNNNINNNTSDPSIIKSQLKTLQTRLITNRKNIDSHIQKNKSIQTQINQYRKQISTLKKINQSLQLSYFSTIKKYQQQYELSKILDEQIGNKNQMIYKKKVENMHKKAQMIKQYDVILRNLEKQLGSNNDKEKSERQQSVINEDNTNKGNFYLTDLANNNTNSIRKQLNNSNINNINNNSNLSLSTYQQTRSSSKRLKTFQLHNKLKSYQQQFQQLKTKLGSDNIQQITKKFTNQYEKNFNQYNFINQIYQQYEQINEQQIKLIERKRQVMKEIEKEKQGEKVKEMLQYKRKLDNVQKKKNKIKKDMQIYQNMEIELKKVLKEYVITNDNVNQSDKNNMIEQINDENNITKYLYTIYQSLIKSKQTIDTTSTINHPQIQRQSPYVNTISRPKPTQPSLLKTISTSNHNPTHNIDQLLQQVIKNSQTNKQTKLLSREEFQNNTVYVKQKKMESSINNKKFINQNKFLSKKDIQKNRGQYGSKMGRSQMSNN